MYPRQRRDKRDPYDVPTAPPWRRPLPAAQVTGHSRSRPSRIGHDPCMDNDNAHQAREGLLDSVAGKAKEVAGAVSGKDDLVEEGQLQQAEARNRKDAVAEEALADAKRADAAREVSEASREAAQQEGAAHQLADQQRSAAQRDRDQEHAAAEREAARQQEAGTRAAEERGDEVAGDSLQDAQAIAADASATEQQAAVESAELQREAAVAEQQAAQLRSQDEK